MPQTVLRRYTPPTCTLEVMATGSALSRWTDRAVLKNLRFRLHLDDPKVAADDQVAVQGDRNQLEALCETVDSYVQNWLSRSRGDFLPAQRIEAGSTAIQVLEPTTLQNHSVENHPIQAAMSLEPQGLLTHRLHLGTMANEQSGESVTLSTLQLFDLANALDQYQSDAVALPSLARPGWMRSPAGWAGIAAAAVLTVGVTGAIAKFVMDVSSPPMQTASKSVQTETNLSQGTPPTPLAIPSPSPGTPSPSLSLTPLPPPAPPTGAIQPAPLPPPVSIAREPVPVAPAPAPPAPRVEVPRSTTPPPPERIAIVPSQGAGQAPTTTVIPEIGSSAARLPRGGTAEQPADSNIAAANAPAGEAGTGEAARSAANSGTAFDTLPQVAEIRQYFEQNWKPPTELTQTLEYRLVLNADGSLQRIVPLGQAAETFLDRTNMPLMGEPFVSPTDNGGNPQIRLVLRPDGKVQTFLEYAR